MLSRLHNILLHPRFVLWAMGLGFGLRLLFLLVFQPEPISDFADYHELAASIAAGEGYAVHGVLTAFRPVGWPALLAVVYAVTGPIPLAGQLFTLLMGMGVLWLGYLLGKQLSGKEEVGRLVLLLLAVHPNGIAYAQLLSAEVPFLLLVLGGVLLMNSPRRVARGRPSLKKRGARIPHSKRSNDLLKAPSFPKRGGLGVSLIFAIAGILFGLATLIKSQGFFLPLIFGLVLLWNGEAERRRETVKLLGLVFVFMGLSVAPWLVRNYMVFDTFPVLVTNGSANLLVGNNPFANGKYKWGDQEIAWYEAQAPQASGEIAHADKARSLAFQYIRENPGKSLSRMPKKLWYTYAHDYEGLDWLRESCGGLSGWKHRLMQVFKAFGQILYLIILFLILRATSLSLLSLVPHPSASQFSESASRFSPLLRISLLLLLYFSLIVMLIFGDGRFHFPLMPFLFLMAAVQLIPNSFQELPGEQEPA